MSKKPYDQNEPLSDNDIIDKYIDSLAKKDKKQKNIKKSSRFIRRRRALVALLLSFIIVAVPVVTALTLNYTKVFTFEDLKGIFSASSLEEVSSKPGSQPVKGETDIPTTENEENEGPYYGTPDISTDIYATFVEMGKDFLVNDAKGFLATLGEIKSGGFNSVFIDLNGATGLIIDSSEGKSFLKEAYSLAHKENITLYGILDVSEFVYGDVLAKDNKEKLKTAMSDLSKEGFLDGIFLDNLARESRPEDYKEYLALGSVSGYEDYSRNCLTALVSELRKVMLKSNEKTVFGIITDAVYAKSGSLENGIETTLKEEAYFDKNLDAIRYLREKLIDMVFVRADTATGSKSLPFERLINWWSKSIPEDSYLGFILPGERAMKGQGDFKNPDQLTRQLMLLKEKGKFTFCIDSFAALKADTAGGAKLVYKYLNGSVGDDYVLRELTFTSPKKLEFTTYENKVSIIGASDPNFELILNGQKVSRTEYGYFSVEKTLKGGLNTFRFEHKGTVKTFKVNYRYVVIKDYSPASAIKMDSGSTLIVKATARKGSKLTATFNGKTVTMESTEGEADSDFITFVGGLKMPEVKKDTAIGKITFKGSHGGVSESFKSGTVTVKKMVEPEIPSINQGGSTGNNGYISVGNNLIAEVNKYQAESFDGDKVDDLSQPYNNYLPKGTVDYCEENKIYDPGSKNSYRKLRYGKRIYESNITLIKGKLPNSNKLEVDSLKTVGNHTVLTLDVDWKAPFTFNYPEQKYYSAVGSERGTITSATFSYIDITFCYASEFKGDLESISEGSVFSKAQIIKNKSDYTLRLYLKKVGAFYGWTADYNSSGDLVFKFLNPKKATVDSNKYGGRLDGITVVVDAGHGGSDGGAVGSNPKYDEADRSLELAKKIQSKLESIGATVVMTRSDDTTLERDTRILKVKNAAPDFAISVHRNASLKASANGMWSCYFNPYTKSAADEIMAETKDAGLYSNTAVKWHVFYLSRITDCPVVLTENGFMSNSKDYNNMLSDSYNDKCADAIVKGTVKHFLGR